jgi:hypothetical protein
MTNEFEADDSVKALVQVIVIFELSIQIHHC